MSSDLVKLKKLIEFNFKLAKLINIQLHYYFKHF